MKTIQVTTRAKADAMQVNSLFKPVNGNTLSKLRYNMGKYKNSGVGRNANVSDDVHALWFEQRLDSEGPYYAMYCLTN